jgi:hypothetical protein
MARSSITLPQLVGPAGETLDTWIPSGETAHREIDRIGGADADDLAAVTDTDPSPGTDHALVVKPLDAVNPIRDYVTSSALAAGGSVDLDGTAISSGATGKVERIYVASSVPCKWVLKMRDGAVEVVIGVLFTTAARLSERWEPPSKHFDTLAYVGGDENFRVTATNNDQQNAADVYATMYWDEVT